MFWSEPMKLCSTNGLICCSSFCAQRMKGSRTRSVCGIEVEVEVEVNSLCAAITLAALEIRFAAQAKSKPTQRAQLSRFTVHACPQRQLVGFTAHGLRLPRTPAPNTGWWGSHFTPHT